MPTSAAGHRVIGIRHTLKVLKAAGLVEQDTLRPQDAVTDLQDEILAVAERWYGVGAKRGALEVLDAFLNGDLKVKIHPDGQRQIVACRKPIVWSRRLNVVAGNNKKYIAQKEYQLTLEELGFDV